jgi:hypothetical protein
MVRAAAVHLGVLYVNGLLGLSIRFKLEKNAISMTQFIELNSLKKSKKEIQNSQGILYRHCH